jgi:hypothetical protein
MHAGEFAQGQSDGQCDERGQEKTENHSRTGDFECCRRSQKQSGTDRPTHGDHSHLAGGELVLKASFFNVFRHLAPISETFFPPKAYSRMTFVIGTAPEFVAAVGSGP